MLKFNQYDMEFFRHDTNNEYINSILIIDPITRQSIEDIKMSTEYACILFSYMSFLEASDISFAVSIPITSTLYAYTIEGIYIPGSKNDYNINIIKSDILHNTNVVYKFYGDLEWLGLLLCKFENTISASIPEEYYDDIDEFIYDNMQRYIDIISH